MAEEEGLFGRLINYVDGLEPGWRGKTRELLLLVSLKRVLDTLVYITKSGG